MNLIVVKLGAGVTRLPMPDGTFLEGAGPFEVVRDHYVMRRIEFDELVALPDGEAEAFRAARTAAEAKAEREAVKQAVKQAGKKEGV